MVPVRRIEVRPDGDAEIAARPLMHGTQEAGLAVVALPVARNVDLEPVLEPETADVRCVGECVLAAHLRPFGVADDVAAVVRTHVGEPDYAAAVGGERER